MISTEKPGTPEELVHFGVKGMKWGVRKSQGTRQFEKKFPTNRQRTEEIKRARRSVRATKEARPTSGNRAERRQERKQLKDIHLSNPDRATALRLTRGEKVVLALMVSTPGLGLATTAGVGIRVGRRRALED